MQPSPAPNKANFLGNRFLSSFSPGGVAFGICTGEIRFASGVFSMACIFGKFGENRNSSAAGDTWSAWILRMVWPTPIASLYRRGQGFAGWRGGGAEAKLRISNSLAAGNISAEAVTGARRGAAKRRRRRAARPGGRQVQNRSDDFALRSCRAASTPIGWRSAGAGGRGFRASTGVPSLPPTELFPKPWVRMRVSSSSRTSYGGAAAARASRRVADRLRIGCQTCQLQADQEVKGLGRTGMRAARHAGRGSPGKVFQAAEPCGAAQAGGNAALADRQSVCGPAGGRALCGGQAYDPWS